MISKSKIFRTCFHFPTKLVPSKTSLKIVVERVFNTITYEKRKQNQFQIGDLSRTVYLGNVFHRKAIQRTAVLTYKQLLKELKIRNQFLL